MFVSAFTTVQKKPTQGHVHRTHGYHMGGTAMMAFVILLSDRGRKHPKVPEARRRPPRVRSLMEIVGSDEQLACVGFALRPAARTLRARFAWYRAMERTGAVGRRYRALPGECNRWWKTRDRKYTCAHVDMNACDHDRNRAMGTRPHAALGLRVGIHGHMTTWRARAVRRHSWPHGHMPKVPGDVNVAPTRQSAFWPMNWSSLSSKRMLKVVRLP